MTHQMSVLSFAAPPTERARGRERDRDAYGTRGPLRGDYRGDLTPQMGRDTAPRASTLTLDSLSHNQSFAQTRGARERSESFEDAANKAISIVDAVLSIPPRRI
ncbi:hypothetical protein KIPB_004363 [Kipferlia bialata]|uniref:Uncharacterized protein n=1 Tax=Kipferlia bialata TaxID=797122 RepID=A0A9K3CTP3_9EUKA|nr:hypothetical protein KIPB_004363 [Kipferlia bialata]|eukprot:g4363.t1